MWDAFYEHIQPNLYSQEPIIVMRQMYARFTFVADASKVSSGHGNGSTPFAVVDSCSEESLLT